TVLVCSRAATPETWEWDGNLWSIRGSASAMPPDLGYENSRPMTTTFDSVRGRVIALTDVAQTWSWDGTSWTNLNPPANPTGQRCGAVMACDTLRGRTALFGGYDASATPIWYGDTWEWDGSTWSLRSAFFGPAARFEQCMAFDPVRGRVVMYG